MPRGVGLIVRWLYIQTSCSRSSSSLKFKPSSPGGLARMGRRATVLVRTVTSLSPGPTDRGKQEGRWRKWTKGT